MVVKMLSRRWAERFAELIDRTMADRSVGDNAIDQPVRRHSRHRQNNVGEPDALVSLAHLGRRLADEAEPFAAQVRMDSDFRAELRARLMADAERHGIGATRVAADPEATRQHQPAREPLTDSSRRILDPRPHRPRVRLAVIGTAAASVLTISGVAAASTSAVPGDALYNVKRSTERAQIALAGSDVNSGALYLEFARTRIAEAEAVRQDPASLENVLRDMDRQTRKGVSLLDSTAVSRRDAASLEQVGKFVEAQRPDVLTLLHGTDGAPQERVRRSLTLLDEVSQRRGNLRRLLLCTAGKPVQKDALGPLPQNCSALPGSATAPSHDRDNGSGTTRPARPGATPDQEGSRSPRREEKPTPSPDQPKDDATHSDTGGAPVAPPLPHNVVPSPSTSPTQGSGSDDGGLLGIIGKILGGLL